MSELNVVEASIQQLQKALSSGAVTSVELVSKYLARIAAYDYRGPLLNSIPIINENVFAEAAASDERRRSGATSRPLEGIPFTLKDSFKVRGMTVASGSPAFAKLVANEDAYIGAAIRAAGGVLIGKTNMPSMAYGGMQRGVYGRAESPYNPAYLAAAFASGSSNGSAVSTATSFAAFGMGSETVSSGRSPASNNGLVAYTPSRGWLSVHGIWPLYPTCDAAVPHTRTTEDLLTLLEVIMPDDKLVEGDFWRQQHFIKLEKPWPGGPSALRSIKNPKTSSMASLQGLRIAVPAMYIGGAVPAGAKAVHVADEVVELWHQAAADLERLGAEIVVVPDFPAVTAYENPSLLPAGVKGLPADWHSTERGKLVAYAWDGFLRQNGDSQIPNLGSVDGLSLYPDSMRTAIEIAYMDPANAIHWAKLSSYCASSTIWDIEDMESALQALVSMQEALVANYLKTHGCHCFAFPAAGDVGPEDADATNESADKAWANGVHYSHGNRAMRHLGIPSVTVPMGIMQQKRMPMGLTFAGPANSDLDLLRSAHVFFTATRRRIAPPATPALPSDSIPGLVLVAANNGQTWSSSSSPLVEVEIRIDDKRVPTEQITVTRTPGPESEGPTGSFVITARHTVPKPPAKVPRPIAPVALQSHMVVITAKAHGGSSASAGWLGLVKPVAEDE
ncbi:amidase signature domain-containing protein [Microdochium bolleyi]|uniref:Amidase signature domain-containing protein n=1 Tax=Microdochium bolleyi TaxID=196109 RepID=A0A136IM17_9PEZI|nr:amidase signature domain-containing protein [Microdochium bolleyi]